MRRKTKPTPKLTTVGSVESVIRSLHEVERCIGEDEKKFDKLESKLDKQEKKLDKLEKKRDKLEAKLDKQEKKLDKLEKKLDAIEKKLDKGGLPDDPTLLAQASQVIGEIAVEREALSELEQAQRKVPTRRAVALGQSFDPDKLEKLADASERIYDLQEERADRREKILDRQEKRFDRWEKHWDQVEKILDSRGSGRTTSQRRQIENKRKAKRKATGRRRPTRSKSALRAAANPADLIADLAHGGSRSRRSANILEQMGSDITADLIGAYDSAGEHQRWEIVNLLGYIRDPKAIPLLVERGIQDRELHPRWRSIWALTSIDDGTAVSRLRRSLSANRGIRQRNAAVALSLFDDRAAVPILRRGLTSPDSWIRWESASCLVGFADFGAAAVILRQYPHESESDVRLEIVRALAGVDETATVSFLKRRLRDKDEQIRAAAVDALVQSVGVRSRPVLQSQLTKEKRPTVRRVIRDALSFAA